MSGSDARPDDSRDIERTRELEQRWLPDADDNKHHRDRLNNRGGVDDGDEFCYDICARHGDERRGSDGEHRNIDRSDGHEYGGHHGGGAELVCGL